MYVCMYVAPKLSHAPLLIKQKLISTPPLKLRKVSSH